MRWLRGDCGGCDSLDVAAVWPSTACVGGFPLPELNSARRKGEESEIEEKKEVV
jgi:hypothetical protein